MNYGQFLNMMPEAFFVLELIVMFIADFALTKSETKLSKLWTIAVGTLLFQTCLLFGTMEPTSAFGGLYVSSQAINAMKIILTAGTLIVVMMSRGWLETNRTYSGEFFMLVQSTLLGMYMMMSSGHFMMFFLGLEMASVPMACTWRWTNGRKTRLRLVRSIS